MSCIFSLVLCLRILLLCVFFCLHVWRNGLRSRADLRHETWVATTGRVLSFSQAVSPTYSSTRRCHTFILDSQTCPSLECVCIRLQNIHAPHIDSQDKSRPGPFLLQLITFMFLLHLHCRFLFVNLLTSRICLRVIVVAYCLRTGESLLILVAILSSFALLLSYHLWTF